MASHRVVVLAAACALAASGVAAQTADKLTPVQTADKLTPVQIAVACAPPPVVASVPAEASRVIGAQDSVNRNVFGTPEVLVISGGTDKGMVLGQEYFVRRVARTAETYRDKLPHQVYTVGWLRVVAVNETTTIARKKATDTPAPPKLRSVKASTACVRKTRIASVAIDPNACR